MTKIGLATIWLDGCSGCHMSLLDLDEGLLDLAGQVELLVSPLVDRKDFPESVDVTLVEGAVSSTADREKIAIVRARSRILVSLGDCAITANVPAMRNRFAVADVLGRGYLENSDGATVPAGGTPSKGLPRLCRHARPVHEFVPVDLFLPGCPPPPAAILHLLSELLAGRMPDMRDKSRFGA
jgi:NAD-reducing hydrogenase small subunit